MIGTDLVCIYGSNDHARVQSANEQLLQGGISTVLIRSDRESGAWDIEVASDDVAAARVIIESV